MNNQTTSVRSADTQDASLNGVPRVNWLLFSWLVFALAVALRLILYCGYGLGDDVNDVHLTEDLLVRQKLDPGNAHHYRLLTLLPRALSFSLFGVSDFSFILPIFLFALGTFALSIVAARDIFGPRAAFFVALIFLTTPFEFLASTANAYDYINAFFAVGCLWQLALGLREDRPRSMVYAGALLVAGVLNKVSGLGLVPLAVLATVFSPSKYRLWIRFWLTLSILFVGLTIADYFYSGGFMRWLFYNNFFDGYDESNRLAEVLLVFPRTLFYLDQFGNWMFGATGWLCLAGCLYALFAVIRGQKTVANATVLSCAVFLLLVNFLPHKLTLSGYYSHPRVFRYLAFVVPAIYLPAAYFIDRLAAKNLLLGAVVAFAAFAFNSQQVLPVSYPSRDWGDEGRALNGFFEFAMPPNGSNIYADSWKCMRLSGLLQPIPNGLVINCMQDSTIAGKIEFLSKLTEGFVVTGGGAMPWYGSMGPVVNLSELEFEVPENWIELFTYPAAVTPWRVEPLKIWRITKPT